MRVLISRERVARFTAFVGMVGAGQLGQRVIETIESHRELAYGRFGDMLARLAEWRPDDAVLSEEGVDDTARLGA